MHPLTLKPVAPAAGAMVTVAELTFVAVNDLVDVVLSNWFEKASEAGE